MPRTAGPSRADPSCASPQSLPVAAVLGGLGTTAAGLPDTEAALTGESFPVEKQVSAAATRCSAVPTCG